MSPLSEFQVDSFFFVFQRSMLLAYRPCSLVIAADLSESVRRSVRIAGVSVALPYARARSPAAGRVPS